jgi:death on curing protein
VTSSALAKPFGKPTMPALGAAYAAGIVKNHPFLDGNKRTGFMMGAGFLERNGFEFYATEAEAVLQTLALAAGQITEASYAEWLKANSKRASTHPPPRAEKRCGSTGGTAEAVLCCRDVSNEPIGRLNPLPP